jgi:hypothetical protein
VKTALLLLSLIACKDDEPEYSQFNGTDVIEIEVTAADDLGESVEEILSSSTGTVDIGTVTVTPGSGPVGTDHDVLIDIDDDFEDLVVKATVVTDAGDRGDDEYELRQDSADHGVWVLTLTSLGAEGEERTDTFTIYLWQYADIEVIIEDEE